MTLLILAAGMGSRFGGLKQVQPVGPSGEFIIDYSCHDAVKAGFDRIVFVIKKENLEVFRDTVGKRVEPYAEVKYVFQDPDDLPGGFRLPEGRTKPWGTGHAVLSAEKVIDDNFATVNADDFYGYESFRLVCDHLRPQDPKALPVRGCMAGYMLNNTLTENGSVSRGICSTDASGRLSSITERTKIFPDGDAAFFEEEGKRYPLPGDCTVSMNFFGLTPAFFSFCRSEFSRFLGSMKNPLKDEFYLPFAVSSAMNAGLATVSVLPTSERWFGVTYGADLPRVRSAIVSLIDRGVYRDDLWSDL